MKASIIKNGLPTGVTSAQIQKILEEAGSNYIHYDNEQYPDNHGMSERVILIHKDAKVFHRENVELGTVFAFTEQEANEIFSKREKELYQ